MVLLLHCYIAAGKNCQRALVDESGLIISCARQWDSSKSGGLDNTDRCYKTD
jgi:hypothetical protein